MFDATKTGLSGKFLIHVKGVDVACDLSEKGEVLFGDGIRNGDSFR